MSLLETLGSLITPQIVGSLASRLGESESAVQKGLQGGAAALLSSLAGRASDSGFLSQILALLTSGGGSAGFLGSLSSLAGGQPNAGVSDLGNKFLGLVLGNNQTVVTDAISSAAGLKGSSASSLLSMAAPLVMGILGQKVSQGGLNASSLGQLLQSEAPSLAGLLPGGLGSLLGSLPSLPNLAAASLPEAKEGVKWLWPLVIGLALLAGVFWLMNQGPKAEPVKEAVVETAKTAETAVATTANSMWAALGELFKRKLPNGLELSIPKLGVENRLIDFIEDAAKPVDKTTWFDFDRLLFDTGKATLQAASSEQLTNVANILKAFPNVELRIGGYTDNTGDKAANLKLSTDRAASVRAELVTMGIDAGRLTSEGYGDQFPVGDNSTEEGRQKNRRVSMRVTKK
ncbi:MAG: DUF937 domain-containing protein [Bryobacteraceae bacterium]|nr:DUF937 domain-containing protein [Bryobacteraceae bacterium]